MRISRRNLELFGAPNYELIEVLRAFRSGGLRAHLPSTRSTDSASSDLIASTNAPPRIRNRATRQANNLLWIARKSS